MSYKARMIVSYKSVDGQMAGKGRHVAHVRRVVATMASSLASYLKREVSPPSLSLFLYIVPSYYIAISLSSYKSEHFTV